MLVANYLPGGHDVVVHAENGIVRAGPVSTPGTEEPDRRNAGNLPVSLLPGGCYVDRATSFAMIRGGHIDATMIGTLQVDGDGSIANYEMPGRKTAAQDRRGRRDGSGGGCQARVRPHGALRQGWVA